MDTADFFLALDHQLHVDRHAQARLQAGFEGLYVHVNLTLVVIRSPSEYAPVPHRRLERRRLPELHRVHRLYVIVAVHEQGRQIGIHDVFGNDDRLPFGLDDLDRGHPRTPNVVSYPVSASLDILRMPRLGADAGNRQELAEFLLETIPVLPQVIGQGMTHDSLPVLCLLCKRAFASIH